jgi:sugar/nucleoside kinase (ribokinase family)
MSSLLVTGSIALDTVETETAKMENQLGGSATYFSLAGSILNPVRLVGAVGEDFPMEHTQILTKHNVDIKGLEVRQGSKTFRWHGKYSKDMNNRTTIDVALNILAERGPKIPQDFADSKYVFLANSHPELQMELLDQLKAPKFSICDTMDLWIDNNRPSLCKLLSRINGIVLNDGEARQLTGEDNLLTAAIAVSKLGPKLVVIKKGEHGAMLYNDGRVFLLPAYPTQRVIDPTGAGDSFAGGFMGYLANVDKIDFEEMVHALIYGTIIASFTVESFSLNGIADMTRGQIDKRRGEFMGMIGTDLKA